MPETSFSIQDLAEMLKIPVPLLERAVENGLLIPTEPVAPYFFSKEEVEQMGNWAAIPQLLSRVKRDPNGDYVGRHIGPDEYVQQNRYILPFEGCWLVTDGGKLRTSQGRMRSFDYYMAPCIRWAWDFCAIAPEDYDKCYPGMSVSEMLRLRFRREQKENVPDYAHSEPEEPNEFRKVLNPEALESSLHYLYKVNLVAPAAGTILTRQGHREDPAFKQRIDFLRTNAEDDDHEGFMIDHGNGEFSQISHVLGRTIRVLPGQQVEQGDFLCKAGARHAFMSHLHWAVWDHWHPVLAQGLPIRISACMVYEKGGFQEKEKVWLERGMLVKNI